MLKLDQVKFSRADQAFKFSFALEVGGSLAIMGASGSGKSTLLDLIAGFEHIDNGKIEWCGDDIGNLAVPKRPLTLLAQNNNLFNHLTVFQNVALGLTAKARLTADEKQQAQEAIDQVGLSDYIGKLPTELSGGQQQRAALARSLLRAKPLLLLDEPFSALDQELRNGMAILVKTIVRQKNMTLITVTHDKTDAELLADKVVRMENGVLEF